MIAPKDIRPLGQRILARKYTHPKIAAEGERADGTSYQIVTPDAWQQDRSLQAFEVVRIAPRAEHIVGMRITPDDIIVTERAWQAVEAPNFIGRPEEDYWWINASDVAIVYPWTPTEEAESA